MDVRGLDMLQKSPKGVLEVCISHGPRALRFRSWGPSSFARVPIGGCPPPDEVCDQDIDDSDCPAGTTYDEYGACDGACRSAGGACCPGKDSFLADTGVRTMNTFAQGDR